MYINCIIVEDEPLALERIKAYVGKLPFLQLIEAFDNSVDALVFIKTNPPDLIFLDINMGELSGIQLLEAARPDCEVIITTAYDEYALKGFELKVTDYLLKPYTFERFMQAAERAKNNIEKNDRLQERNFIFIKTEYRLEKLLLADIIYIEGMRDYRKIHSNTKKIMTLQTFTELAQEIPASIVCRVHKSYMVSIDKIESVEKDRITIKNIIIPISETYKKAFFQLIGQSNK